jgi:hypothetical protein
MNRQFFVFLFFYSFILPFSSCTTDTYDKGEGELSMMRAELVEAHANGDKLIDWCMTDESERLVMTQPQKVSGVQTADSIYRVMLYYNKVEKGADIIAAAIIPTLAPHRIKDMKTDPVRFESMWMSTSRRYLNMGLYLRTGETGNDKQHHTIGINLDTLVRNADGKRTAYLHFYHDQGGLPEYYSQRTFLSIPTDSIDADSVCLRVNTYQGVTEKRFKK